MKCGKHWEEKRLEFVKADGSEMTEEEIAQHWAFKGKVASARGTLLHYHCEAHLNGRHVAEPRSQEFEQFLLLEAVLAEMGYHAFRTEVCLFHCGLVVAGQPDALFANSVGELCLLDWKRRPRRARGTVWGPF